MKLKSVKQSAPCNNWEEAGTKGYNICRKCGQNLNIQQFHNLLVNFKFLTPYFL